MHCLGAVADSSSSIGLNNGLGGNRGGVLSVVRALGVLVCEGRIQGSPRGYKEGPHCAAPQQAVPVQHECEKDNYLCNRYLVLIKEIAVRTAIGAQLCVEVFMCSDCPCGLAAATCNNPVSPIPSTLITQWPHSCELLLEYWCIGVVPSTSSEMMNSQGLYQAVRSRLHFSQVAAWWSRSNGTKPAYVATRVVPYSTDNLRKFREIPVEHIFPLASIGDGNSVKVTVWALPRMEDVPTLLCPLHLAKDIQEDKCTARALTPTKNLSSSRPDSTLVLPHLVDDRLQTPCNKPGKHHCRCEEEDGSPPSPCIKPNGERKRRRSLPCGPPDAGSCSNYGSLPLASVTEIKIPDCTDTERHFTDKERRSDAVGFDNRSYLSTGTLERCFKTQVSLEEPEGNDEKRYKPSSELLEAEMQQSVNNSNSSEVNKLKFFVPFVDSQDLKTFDQCYDGEKKLETQREPNVVVNPFSERHLYKLNPGPSYYSTTRNNNPITMACTAQLNYSKLNKPMNEQVFYKLEKKSIPTQVNCHNGNKDLSHLMSKLSFPKEPNNKIQKEEGGIFDWISKVPGRVLNSTANNTTEDVNKSSKRDFKYEHLQQQQQIRHSHVVKFKNCHLELSQREFDEVLAVLRAKTPSNKRRTPTKTVRKRERAEKIPNDNLVDKIIDKNYISENYVCPIHRVIRQSSMSGENCFCQFCKSSTTSHDSINSSNIYKNQNKSAKKDLDKNDDGNDSVKHLGKSSDYRQNSFNKADVLLGAILRTSRGRKGLSDISNGTRSRRSISDESNDDICQETQSVSDEYSDSSIVSSEDDKFLPSVLNKRLNRFKQLFRKDQDRRESPEVINVKECDDSLSEIRDTQKINMINNRVKRKIVFTNFPQTGNKELLNDEDDKEIANIMQGNSHFHSTNYMIKDLNNHEGLINKSFLSSNNRGIKDRYNNCITINDDEEIVNGSEGKNKRLLEESHNFSSIDDEIVDKATVPSAIEQERFRRSLENAASMVFHSRTGLPLTSSPAPLRRGSCCFDYDSSLNSVSSKRSALFELNTPPSPGAVSLEETDREVENAGDGDETPKRSTSSRSRPQSHALLGSFEESALNGRLEPVSTVHGFTAEIGASGSFCPKHRKLPVTVFFYTLGDNDKVSTPYLAHINLGKKGYQVPRSGTIQVTLLNPLGTVVKMFVVLYDLSDMPPRSHTFLRQRTLRDKTLRYLIHLRFMSGKSGRIYLHTDIRIIICRKSDVDTASDFGSEPPKELRSYIHGPTNPKFSPRC
ncbi:protein FAM214A [Chelonus insularis]|uniref:protein FAM214A n=1 Tax=Chelonus insularis TaxID=460826 RepID=UPI00158CC48F|nr:protein FAM214A [Chelonus insularis]XP_034940324.1 protein FAM214A [Chelonus insularis]